MRYYIYLDKEFLRTLFSTEDNSGLNIDVFEFSITNSYTTNNNVSLNPGLENIKDDESFCKNDTVEDMSSSYKLGGLNKQRVDVSYANSNSYNTQTQRRYLNIDDVVNIKNINFYHKLLENIRDTLTRSEDSRIILTNGFIYPINKEVIDNINISDNENDDFFMINDMFVWYDKSKLNGSISLISNMYCKVNLVGYMMNCREYKNNKILKAISIYID